VSGTYGSVRIYDLFMEFPGDVGSFFDLWNFMEILKVGMICLHDFRVSRSDSKLGKTLWSFQRDMRS
jgi:hypothetical protein